LTRPLIRQLSNVQEMMPVTPSCLLTGGILETATATVSKLFLQDISRQVWTVLHRCN
jgi:hypothetical protein